MTKSGCAIADEAWQDFLRLLVGHQTPMFEEDASPLPSAVGEILESLRVLSFHVSAIGLDRELVRIDPHLEEHESPLPRAERRAARLHRPLQGVVDHPGALIADDKHLTVMLHQCDEVLQRVRKRAMRVGTSLTLTFKLERLRQHLERIHELIALLGELRIRRVVEDAAPRIVRLFKTLVRAECRKNILSDYWGQNVELLSLRMTESASRTGEHYITSSRRSISAVPHRPRSAG